MSAEQKREYNRWRNMLDRCENPRMSRYQDYGGRGIRVCERWHDFVTYKEDIARILGPCPSRMSLDRIDNDGDYEPGNVRWATSRQQRDNSRGRSGGRLARYRQYVELRDTGMDVHGAARAVGVDPFSTGNRYERWRTSGVPLT